MSLPLASGYRLELTYEEEVSHLYPVNLVGSHFTPLPEVVEIQEGCVEAPPEGHDPKNTSCSCNWLSRTCTQHLQFSANSKVGIKLRLTTNFDARKLRSVAVPNCHTDEGVSLETYNLGEIIQLGYIVTINNLRMHLPTSAA